MSALLLVLAGCGVRLPDPVIDLVEPDRGWSGEETVVAVEGSNFYPEVEIDLNRRGSADLDLGFTGWLERDGLAFPLRGVSAVDYSNLTAVVRSGLPTGRYDLVVVGPSGRTGRLAQAFTVSDTRADRLAFDDVPLVWTVNEVALLTVRLVDPRGQPVLQDLPVELRARGLTAPVDATFGAGLIDQHPTPDGHGIRGFLGPDGQATLPIAVHAPDTIELTIAPADPHSAVRGASTQLVWNPGAVASIAIELPQPGFSVAAGEPFPIQVSPLDGFGNLVEPAGLTVVLQGSCEDWIGQATLQGTTVVEVLPETATDFGNCGGAGEAAIRVVLGVPGISEPFQVRAGPAQRFEVTVPPVVRAGERVSALISPRDAWGNRTAFGQPLTLVDSLGGLIDVSCAPFVHDDQLCTGTATVAGVGVQAIAQGGALQGQSAPYLVLSSLEVVGLEVEPQEPAVAGQGFLVAVRARDPFGNLVAADELGEPLALGSVEGDCLPAGQLADGAAAFTCTLTLAQPSTALQADYQALSALSDPFPVVNGPLAAALVLAPATVTAGDPFTTAIEAFDAWGNPYLTQTVGAVELGEADGPRLSVPLDALGQGSATLALPTARLTALQVWSGPDAIGISAPILVQPGPTAALQVRPQAPWAWVDQPVQVQVLAVDAFGNRTATAIPVELTAPSGLAAPVSLALVGGEGTASLTWTAPALDESILASGPELTGSAAPLQVVASCPIGGPIAAVDFAGAPVGRACLEADGPPVEVVISFVGSVAGATPTVGRLVSLDGGAAVDGGAVAFPVPVDRVGRTAVDALVVAADGCASAAHTAIWAGPDDGGAVGPLHASADATSLQVGVDSTVIRVLGAVDCTGDPATGAVIGVRADRGILDAPPTGAGLAITLDPSGSGQFTLDASLARTGGVGTVWLGSPSGGAAEQIAVELLGDDRPPTVWEQTPSGAIAGPIDTIVLRFDEPLLAATVGPTAFAIAGPHPATVAQVALLAPDTVEILPDMDLDGAAGAWTLTATDALRDAAGNRLDGAGIGGPSAWVGPFGAVGGLVDGVACTVSPARFRPDGDPGAGEEADAVELTLWSASAPAWWVISARDGEGGLVARERLAAAGPLDGWSWDGRDVSERVVADGTYTLSVEPDDGFGNRGAGCAAVVVVDNQAEAP